VALASSITLFCQCLKFPDWGWISQEPQQAFHSRIAFCLNTHNEAVKALRFPRDAHKKDLESSEKRQERQQQELELAKHIAEEDDDGF